MPARGRERPGRPRIASSREPARIPGGPETTRVAGSPRLAGVTHTPETAGIPEPVEAAGVPHRAGPARVPDRIKAAGVPHRAERTRVAPSVTPARGRDRPGRPRIAGSREPARIPGGPETSGVTDGPTGTGVYLGEGLEVVSPPDAAEPPGVAGPAEAVRVADLAELTGVAPLVRRLEFVTGQLTGRLPAGEVLPPGVRRTATRPSASPGIVRPGRMRTRNVGTLSVPCPVVAAAPHAAHLCLTVQSLKECHAFTLVDPRSLAPIVPSGYAADRANHAMKRIP
jgi:hypothetical protein